MKALRSILAGSAVAAFAMTSCTADEQISQNTTDGAIRFSVNTANQTRALNSYCANEMPAYFNVYADYTADGSKKLYIDGDEVNQVEGNTYQSSALRYWPEKDYPFNFYAYVDAAGSFKYNSGTPIFENFTVESDVNNQLDLMYATVIGMRQTTKEDGSKEYGTVNLNFRHALSQICYKAKNENPNIEITVNSITISGIGGTGTYNFPTESTTGNYEHHTDSENAPTSELARGAWETIAESSQTSSYSVTPEDGLIPSDGTAKGLTTFSGNTDDESHIQTGETKTYSNALNLIPQDRGMASVAEASTTPTNGAYFTLNLTIKNNLNKSENQVGEKTTIVANKDFYVPADINWTQGNRYIYTFNFAKDWQAITPITYTVNVDDFITGEEIELPRNVIKGTTNSSEAFNISVNGSPKNVTPDETTNSEGSYNFYVDLGPGELESLKFTDCKTITSLDLSGVDTRKVTDMSEMFKICNALTTLDLSNFDTSKVTDMRRMFIFCNSLTKLDVSNFDTSKVTDMYQMFGGCSSLSTLDVSSFDTSKVTNMGAMFYDCESLTTLDLSKFDTSSVTSMFWMFTECRNLTTLDVSNFDTSKVTDMRAMFSSCISLTTPDLSSFQANSNLNGKSMFGSDPKVKITTNEDFKEWLLNNKIVTTTNFPD